MCVYALTQNICNQTLVLARSWTEQKAMPANPLKSPSYQPVVLCRWYNGMPSIDRQGPFMI